MDQRTPLQYASLCAEYIVYEWFEKKQGTAGRAIPCTCLYYFSSKMVGIQSYTNTRFLRSDMSGL